MASSTGRICLISLRNSSAAVINVGVAKVGGVLKWFLSFMEGTKMVYACSQDPISRALRMLISEKRLYCMLEICAIAHHWHNEKQSS
jgi:hypothetical protein